MQTGVMKVVKIKLVYSDGTSEKEVLICNNGEGLHEESEAISDAVRFLAKFHAGSLAIRRTLAESPLKKTADMLDDLIKRWP